MIGVSGSESSTRYGHFRTAVHTSRPSRRSESLLGIETWWLLYRAVCASAGQLATVPTLDSVLRNGCYV